MKKKLKTPQGVILGLGECVKSCGAVFSIGLLKLAQCKRQPLGSKVKDANITSKDFSIVFANQTAVTELINDLKEIRTQMAIQEFQRAADNKPLRHSNKQRKIPGKRAKR